MLNAREKNIVLFYCEISSSCIARVYKGVLFDGSSIYCTETFEIFCRRPRIDSIAASVLRLPWVRSLYNTLASLTIAYRFVMRIYKYLYNVLFDTIV